MTAVSLPRPVGRQREVLYPPALDAAVPLTKAEGAFLALAAGDALGWPQEIRRNVRSNASGTSSPRIEFQTWTRRTGGRYRPYEETIGAGEYSDDTQLTLAVARSRTNHGANWWKAFMRVELSRWTIYERGGGGATKRAAQAWLAGGPPWQSGKTDAVRRYFDEGGNGVAMRVLPHALFLAGQDDPAVLVHDVVRDGAATHGHPRALVDATACAYAEWSLAAAAYLAARHAAQPAQGVLRAAFERGADTDTLAAMTGGLLGCLAGDEWLPEPWRDVQDAAYLRYIAGRVVQGPAGAEQRPVETPAAPPSILTDLARNGDHEVVLSESTRVQATALPAPNPLSMSITIRAWRLTTSEGQTLYVTKDAQLKRAAGSHRAAAGAALQQRTLPGTGPTSSKSDEPVAADNTPKSGNHPGDLLYAEFRRRLRVLLEAGSKRPREVEETLDLVPGQARKWLERAEQDGEVERVSGRPVKFSWNRRSRA